MRGARRLSAGHGGAYLLALTALLALTGLGIALSGIAQIERRLGTADQDRLQALNAADSGLALATARLLAGAPRGELEVVFGGSRAPVVERTSRVRVEAPVRVAAAPCGACDPVGGVGRVSYELAAQGERLVRSADPSRGAPRVIARASVEAIVTLQPWPLPGSPSASGSAGEAGPECAPEPRARLLERLRRELNPPGCRFGPGTLGVRGRDAESGASCLVQVPVCVLLSDWRER